MSATLSSNIALRLGIKSDPITHRYSWEWLLRLMAEEGVRHVQLGTFFELYHLSDAAVRDLRESAESFGVQISSVFTAHRELGGFFHGHDAWEDVAFRNYQRLIQVASLLGADSVGSNPGSVMRDRMDTKASGIRSYMGAMKRLMRYARQHGVKTLTIEPMSCLAEPPTLPEEITEMAAELTQYHCEYPNDTASVGYCFDISHGYVDGNRTVRNTNLELLNIALPYVTEIHLKNTDAILESTFGFGREERERGMIDVDGIRRYLVENASRLPQRDLIGYLEIGGPKLGRDYSDSKLEDQLRTSLRYLRETFATEQEEAPQTYPSVRPLEAATDSSMGNAPAVRVAPSMMCADMTQLRDEVQRMECLGVDLLHWDIMDAHFVPNMPCGLALIEQVRKITALPFDVHLMVENNDFFIAELGQIGVQMISVHYESVLHCDRTLSLIRETGAAAAIALNPSTPPTVLKYVTHLLDFLLVMTVNPGFAGQKLTGSGLAKIADCKAWLHRAGLKIPLEVDGNVSFENIPRMVAAGADILIAGTSSFFHPSASTKMNMRLTKRAIEAGLYMPGGLAMSADLRGRVLSQ